MKIATLAAVVIGALVVAGGIYMIDIDQTQEADLPSIAIEGGQMPAFEADIGEIEMTEETVTVPSITVTPPNNDS
ncbi:MAG: hypothetical protein AAF092_09425 [Pseudomonadota bacterium]